MSMLASVKLHLEVVWLKRISDSDVTPFIGPGAMRVGGYAAAA